MQPNSGLRKSLAPPRIEYLAPEPDNSTNIADGLNALAVCCEMGPSVLCQCVWTTVLIIEIFSLAVIFSAFMLYAFTYKEYVGFKPRKGAQASFFRSFLHSQNYCEWIHIYIYAINFFSQSHYARKKTTFSVNSVSSSSFSGISCGGNLIRDRRANSTWSRLST
jgi:hypothetical protein